MEANSSAKPTVCKTCPHCPHKEYSFASWSNYAASEPRSAPAPSGRSGSTAGYSAAHCARSRCISTQFLSYWLQKSHLSAGYSICSPLRQAISRDPNRAKFRVFWMCYRSSPNCRWCLAIGAPRSSSAPVSTATASWFGPLFSASDPTRLFQSSLASPQKWNWPTCDYCGPSSSLVCRVWSYSRMSPNWIIFCLFLLAFGEILSSVIEFNMLYCYCFFRSYLVAITGHFDAIRSFNSKTLLF